MPLALQAGRGGRPKRLPKKNNQSSILISEQVRISSSALKHLMIPPKTRHILKECLVGQLLIWVTTIQ
jgi:hypothetical protein